VWLRLRAAASTRTQLLVVREQGRMGRSGQVVQLERCLRCGAAMEWRHQTWRRCRFKLGCCEGERCDE
jgi:hypothetical protein